MWSVPQAKAWRMCAWLDSQSPRRASRRRSRRRMVPQEVEPEQWLTEFVAGMIKVISEGEVFSMTSVVDESGHENLLDGNSMVKSWGAEQENRNATETLGSRRT